MDAPHTFHDLPLAERLALRLRGDRAVFLTGEDNLQLSSWNSLSGVVVTIAGRVLGLDAVSRPFTRVHTPATNRTIASTLGALGNGWLTELTVFVSAGAPIVGQTFARVQIVRGLSGGTNVLATLAAGYITAVQPLAWPGSGVTSSLDGPGALRSITGTNPAAGVDWLETVPTGARWRVLHLMATLVTSAAAANRLPQLTIDDGATIYFLADPPEAQTASLTRTWGFGLGTERLVSTSSHEQWGGPIDLLVLEAGRVRVVTFNLQAADDWGAPQLFVEEHLGGAA